MHFDRRHELKYRVDSRSIPQILAHFGGLGFAEIHRARQVSSVYLDTRDFRCFWETANGLLPRKKFRFRVYDFAASDFQIDFVASFETKVSMPDYRLKKVEQNRIVNGLTIREFDQGYGILRPSCLVSYRRRYFSNGEVRMTIDSDLTYSLFSKAGVVAAKRDQGWLQIVEFKFSSDLVKNEILENFPLVPSQFSKYERAIDSLYRKSNSIN